MDKRIEKIAKLAKTMGFIPLEKKVCGADLILPDGLCEDCCGDWCYVKFFDELSEEEICLLWDEVMDICGNILNGGIA